VQHRNSQTDISELLKFTNVIWLKSLDKQTMMASGLTWRLNILSDFLEKSTTEQPAAALDDVRESVAKNRNILARLLAKSGDFRRSLQLVKGSNESIKLFPLTKSHLPRALHFMSETKSQPVRLRFEVQILLKHYSEAFAIASDANLTESDHRKVWLRFLVESLQGAIMPSNKEIVFQRLIADLNQSSGKNIDFYLALIMNMLNVDESLTRFLTEQSIPRESEELRSAWLKWMPMIFQFCSQPPVKFLTLLMRSNPIRFRLIYQQLVHHRGLKEGMKSDDLMDSLKQQKEERIMGEYDRAFSWLKSSERDLDRLDRVVHAHYVLYEWLSTGKRPGLLDRISDVTGSTFEQLEEFCATNPPYFRTKQSLTATKQFGVCRSRPMDRRSPA
jgi:hypothetical protein